MIKKLVNTTYNYAGYDVVAVSAATVLITAAGGTN